MILLTLHQLLGCNKVLRTNRNEIYSFPDPGEICLVFLPVEFVRQDQLPGCAIDPDFMGFHTIEEEGYRTV